MTQGQLERELERPSSEEQKLRSANGELEIVNCRYLRLWVLVYVWHAIVPLAIGLIGVVAILEVNTGAWNWLAATSVASGN